MSSRINSKIVITMLSNISNDDSGGEDEVFNEDIEENRLFPEITDESDNSDELDFEDETD